LPRISQAETRYPAERTWFSIILEKQLTNAVSLAFESK
jgi:hypothetical protein